MHSFKLFGLLLASIATFSFPFYGNASQQEITVLKEQIQVLMKRIETLEKNQKATSDKLSHPVYKVTQESDLPKPVAPLKVVSGNNKVQLALSGQVNRFISFEDNGKNTQLSHKDNAFSSTRLNFTGKGALNEDTTIAGVIEVEIRSDSSLTKDIGASSDPSSSVFFRERRLEAILDSKRFGKVWLGQGPMASDNTSEVDYSGTDVITSGSEIQDQAGGVKFINKKTQKKDVRTIAAVYDNYGQGFRQDRIRYDTPTIQGFVLGASHATRDITDIALKYAGEFDKIKFGAAITAAKNPFTGATRKGWEQYNGSASILFPNGISFMGALGQRNFKDQGRDSGKFWYGKIGYQFNYLECGKTALAVDYARSRAIADDSTFTAADFAIINTERFNSYGLVVVQNIDQLSTEIYGAARSHHLKREGTLFNRILSVVAGVRVKL